MNVSIIFMDLDGTLVGHNEKKTDTSIRRRFEILRRKGVKFGLATSRSPFDNNMMGFTRFYSFEYLILENGSLIYSKDNGEYLRWNEWDEQTEEKGLMVANLKEFIQKSFPLVKSSQKTGDYSYWTHSYNGIKFFFYPKEESLLLRAVDNGFSEIVSYLMDVCKKKGWDVFFTEVSTHSAEIGKANKGEALSYLVNKEGYDLIDTCAIGDEINDIEMLETVGIPAAPSDACEKVRSLVKMKGGILAKKEDGKGVKDILDIIL